MLYLRFMQKWITVAAILCFAATLLTFTWLTAFGVGGFSVDDVKLIDRRETPVKYWSVVALYTAFAMAAVAFAVSIALS